MILKKMLAAGQLIYHWVLICVSIVYNCLEKRILRWWQYLGLGLSLLFNKDSNVSSEWTDWTKTIQHGVLLVCVSSAMTFVPLPAPSYVNSSKICLHKKHNPLGNATGTGNDFIIFSPSSRCASWAERICKAISRWKGAEGKMINGWSVDRNDSRGD